MSWSQRLGVVGANDVYADRKQVGVDAVVMVRYRVYGVNFDAQSSED